MAERVHQSKWHELAGALWSAGWFDRYPHLAQQDSQGQRGFGFGRVPGRRMPLIIVMAGSGFEITALRHPTMTRRADAAEDIVAIAEDIVAELTAEEKGWLINVS